MKNRPVRLSSVGLTALEPEERQGGAYAQEGQMSGILHTLLPTAPLRCSLGEGEGVTRHGSMVLSHCSRLYCE